MYLQGTHDLQSALVAAGYDPGPIDGIPGPSSSDGVSDFKRAIGFNPRPYIGPMTLQLLGLPRDTIAELPWMNEAARMLGAHERRDNGLLRRWLRSDGRALGDPRKLPWCGDYVETAIRLALPNEPFPGSVGENPYLARNWLEFGEECEPCYGAVVIFWRGSIRGHSGHVGFAVARDKHRGRILVRGGNQANMASDAWLRSDRLLGWRAPVTWAPDGKSGLPSISNISSRGKRVSENEA